VPISRQKIRKNNKTNETIEKDEIFFQSLSAQLLDMKQLRKTWSHESLLPSHSSSLDIPRFFLFLLVCCLGTISPAQWMFRILVPMAPDFDNPNVFPKATEMKSTKSWIKLEMD